MNPEAQNEQKIKQLLDDTSLIENPMRKQFESGSSEQRKQFIDGIFKDRDQMNQINSGIQVSNYKLYHYMQLTFAQKELFLALQKKIKSIFMIFYPLKKTRYILELEKIRAEMEITTKNLRHYNDRKIKDEEFLDKMARECNDMLGAVLAEAKSGSYNENLRLMSAIQNYEASDKTGDIDQKQKTQFYLFLKSEIGNNLKSIIGVVKGRRK